MKRLYSICTRLDEYLENSHINVGFLARDSTTDLMARKFISMTSHAILHALVEICELYLYSNHLNDFHKLQKRRHATTVRTVNFKLLKICKKLRQEISCQLLVFEKNFFVLYEYSLFFL